VKNLVVVIALSLLGACAAPLEQARIGLDHPLIGRIWQPDMQTFISRLNARRQIVNADYVLLGEKHDNSAHHRLQAAAVGDLIRAGKKPLIAFEMINTGQAKDLKVFLAGLPRSADDLGAAIGWDKTGWPDWRYYAPIAEAAIKAGLAIAPANFPRAQVRALGRKGFAVLDPDFVARSGLEAPLPKALGEALLDEMYQSHCKMMPRQHLGAVARIQRARDALMAEVLVSQAAAVLIAGNGHTRKDRGAPYYLRRLKPKANILSIGYVEVDAAATSPQDYAAIYNAARLPFDLVWFTPRRDTEDPCQKFAPQLMGLKKKAD
jgi:uncharacterized iron-regulated protein